MLERLTDLVTGLGAPDKLRSDNGSEFRSEVVRDWLARLGGLQQFPSVIASGRIVGVFMGLSG